MIKDVLKALNIEYSSLRHFNVHPSQYPLAGNWIVVDLKPISNNADIKNIISDINKDKEVIVNNGTLYHYDKCNLEHVISEDICNCIKFIEPTTFTVAIYNADGKHGHQPLAIVLDPDITYVDYPEHPHLNLGGFLTTNNIKMFIPDSLCLLEDYTILSSKEYDRILHILDLISIWLFRHQIWQVTNDKNEKGIWIGPQLSTSLEPENYVYHLNPLKNCRCGSRKDYISCCMAKDLASKENISLKLASSKLSNPIHILKRWSNNFNQHHQISRKVLKEVLKI